MSNFYFSIQDISKNLSSLLLSSSLLHKKSILFFYVWELSFSSSHFWWWLKTHLVWTRRLSVIPLLSTWARVWRRLRAVHTECFCPPCRRTHHSACQVERDTRHTADCIPAGGPENNTWPLHSLGFQYLLKHKWLFAACCDGVWLSGLSWSVKLPIVLEKALNPSLTVLHALQSAIICAQILILRSNCVTQENLGKYTTITKCQDYWHWGTMLTMNGMTFWTNQCVYIHL